MSLGYVHSSIGIHEMFLNMKKKDELMGLILCHHKWSFNLDLKQWKNTMKTQCSVLLPFCKCIKLYIYTYKYTEFHTLYIIRYKV